MIELRIDMCILEVKKKFHTKIEQILRLTSQDHFNKT